MEAASEIVLTMFASGLLLGFVGAGGSGFIISILSTWFGLPIHVALGTALAAMLFSSASGAISHYREGNIHVKAGLIVGVAGAAGAWGLSQVAANIPARSLSYMTAGILYLSAGMLWLRMSIAARRAGGVGARSEPASRGVWLPGAIVGGISGSLSGLFGIGSTPFIQVGLMTLLRMPVTLAAGTTMLVIIPIALAGGAGFYGSGNLDLKVLLEVLIGITSGSYIGAKFTGRLPRGVLKSAMVIIPLFGATLLLF